MDPTRYVLMGASEAPIWSVCLSQDTLSVEVPDVRWGVGLLVPF